MDTMRERLLAKCEPVTESGCWIWTGATVSKGYGSINTGVHAKSMLAHRASYECFVGPIADGRHVCHRCDVSYCINPAHLFLGTNLDNIHDSMRKGRRRGLSRNMPKWNARRVESQRKIPLEEHQKIKEAYVAGTNGVKLAKSYGVRSSCIYRILAAL